MRLRCVRLDYLWGHHSRRGRIGTRALDWASWTMLKSWDFILYLAEVFFYEKKKNVSDFPKEEESREISPVDIHSLLDPLAAWSCSSHPFLSSSLGHWGTALHQEEIDP